MGYDFSILKLDQRVGRTFPASLEEIADGRRKMNWEVYREKLMGRGAKEQGDGMSLWMDFGNHQIIVAFGGEEAISLDVHAEWKHVLEVYRELVTIEPHLVIFDGQTGLFHDELSFLQFMAENSSAARGLRKNAKV